MQQIRYRRMQIFVRIEPKAGQAGWETGLTLGNHTGDTLGRGFSASPFRPPRMESALSIVIPAEEAPEKVNPSPCTAGNDDEGKQPT